MWKKKFFKNDYTERQKEQTDMMHYLRLINKSNLTQLLYGELCLSALDMIDRIYSVKS